MRNQIPYSILLILLIVSCGVQNKTNLKTVSLSDSLPKPYATKSSMNFSNVKGWQSEITPKAPIGFSVKKYADGLKNPRWLYVTPNGDVLVAEANSHYSFLKKIGAFIIGASKSNNLKKSADRITLLRDVDGNGIPEIRETFLANLDQPFGMVIIGDWFYVANTNAVWRFPYKSGQVKINEKGKKIIDLPAGKHNRHWARNIITNRDNSKLYIAVGSGSNVAENGIEEELLKANILEMNPDGSSLRIYANGLRNPAGMDWAVGTNTLWTAVNERDELGDELVPDYFTSVKDGGFYGWPYVYFGQHHDPRVKESPEIVSKTIVPDVNLGSHTASLGLAFYTKKSFPKKYHEGAFIAQHGSWNRSVLSGYKVVFVPFDQGKPTGAPEDFLTGFVADLEKDKVYGRPVGIIIMPDGSLLVTDDVNNKIWRVAADSK